MKNKLVLLSGGMDSIAMTLDVLEKYTPERVISLGVNYGQRHFEMENAAATRFCDKRGLKRFVLNVPISQIGGCSLIDKNIPVTTDMAQQRSTVVPQRNAIFMLFAAAFAQQNDCDEIFHGACAEDFTAYRDCRPVFFRLLELAIQAGRTQPVKGAEDILDDLNLEDMQELLYEDSLDWEMFRTDYLDIRVSTPLIREKKEDTLKRILEKYDVDLYVDSYTCYQGTDPQCGVCPACKERRHAFDVCGVKDPVPYANS